MIFFVTPRALPSPATVKSISSNMEREREREASFLSCFDMCLFSFLFILLICVYIFCSVFIVLPSRIGISLDCSTQSIIFLGDFVTLSLPQGLQHCFAVLLPSVPPSYIFQVCYPQSCPIPTYTIFVEIIPILQD